MKEDSGGGSVKSGLSSQSKINVDANKNGMDTIGKDSKPQAVPREGVSSKGKKFSIC